MARDRGFGGFLARNRPEGRVRQESAHELRVERVPGFICFHAREKRQTGKGQIADAFARVENNEVFLHNAHIEEYSYGNLQNHEPKAARKLLLHKSEIRKLFGLAAVKGNTLVPLSFYWKNGKVKVVLAVGKGKAEFDKREDLKEREADREVKRATMKRSKGA